MVAVGDHAILLTFGRDIDAVTVERVRALDGALARNPPVGMLEVVPAMTTLAVVFDPCVTDHETVMAAVAAHLDAPLRPTRGTLHVVEMTVDAESAPDLDTVARRAGRTRDEVIAAHTGAEYTVAMYGFAPGYAYLFGTPDAIALARKPVPGPLVAAGSVIIAGRQCLITPVAMSTGWYAIGRTAMPVLTGDPDRPYRFDVGDTVAFRCAPAAGSRPAP